MKLLLNTSKYNTKLMFRSEGTDGNNNYNNNLPIHVNSKNTHLMSKIFDEYNLVKDLHANGPLPNMNNNNNKEIT